MKLPVVIKQGFNFHLENNLIVRFLDQIGVG